jgi:hypothetical protein
MSPLAQPTRVRNRISKLGRAGQLRDIIIPLCRPRIEPERDAEGWLVIRGDHGWLCGDRRQAVCEFDDLERIERRGRSR